MEVLYIEDHPNNVLLIQRIVQAEGHAFTHAVDGESGRLVLQSAHPDLIFVDLRLPGQLSGFDLIRFIKSQPRLRDIPVVVLTAYGYGDAEEEAEEAGCDAFLHKPADIREVRAVIRQYLGDPIHAGVLSKNGRSWANLPVPK
ncbi:MAG: response regulator [Candidatus Promineifilaceae bacterium]